MKHIKTILIIAVIALQACGWHNGQGSRNGNGGQETDDVKVALENGGQVNLDSFRWTREPAAFTAGEDTITITTAPHTDLWQRTYYHFCNDNAPVLQMQTREQYFSFTVKTDFTQSNRRFDQCGIVMYLDSENWLKGSVEYENEQFQSTDGVEFSQMRICHMYAGADAISFGIYACSPEESSFTAVFTDMKISECMWKAHDGQQPDEL